MKLNYIKQILVFSLFLLFGGINQNVYAFGEADSLFNRHVGNLIYENKFDSAEIVLRNRLTDDKISEAVYLNCHLQLAKMYMKLNDHTSWKKEIDFCRTIEFSKIPKKIKYDFYLELSQSFFSLQVFDSAFHYANLYLSELGSYRHEKYANAKIIIGYYFYLNGKLDQAESNYIEAVAFYPTVNANCEMPLVYSKLALLKLKQNNIDDATLYASQSIKIADSCQNNLYKKLSLIAFNEINIQKGDYKKAYETLIKINELSSEINKEIQGQNIAEIRERYSMNEKDKQFNLIEKDNSVKSNILNYLYFLIGFLILFLALLYFYFQKNKRANKFIQQQSTQLHEQNAVIKDSLNQREFLYRELNHRIKNNLQLITSMLNLQDRYSHYTSYKELIGEITQKINTIALTYAKMFVDGRRTNDIINLKDYINDIAHNVLSSISHDNIRLDIHASEVSTNLDIAIPLGLITNEVITNSIKHAFATQPNPIITINLKEQNDFIHYTIEDNGMGINESFSLENAHSLGSKIIYLLSQQLKSELFIDSSNGTKYSFRIKNLKTIHHENTNL